MATSAAESVKPATPVAPAHRFRGFHVPFILSWRNPYETGLLLAEVLGLFVMFSSTLTLRWFLRAAFWTVGITSVVEWGSRAVTGQRQGLVTTYQPSRFLPLSDSVVNDVASYVSYVFRRVIFGIQHVLDARDPEKGLKLAGLFYAAYVLLGLFSLRKLVLTAIVLAFALPRLYLQFKTEVDELVTKLQAHVHGHVQRLHAKAHEKAGPQINYVKKLIGPRGGFPGTANASPVGEVPTAAAKPTAYTSGSTAASTTVETPDAAPLATTASSHTKTPLTSAAPAAGAVNPDDAFKNFDSVPTLAGNLPIDHEKLSAALAEDKLKQQGK